MTLEKYVETLVEQYGGDILSSTACKRKRNTFSTAAQAFLNIPTTWHA